MIYLLLMAFQVKHLLADYILQTNWIANKSALKNWLKPLVLHSLLHCVGTLVICQFVDPKLSWLALTDGFIHFAIDRSKAWVSRGLTPNRQAFWVALGVDQMAHHLCHYAWIFLLLRDGGI